MNYQIEEYKELKNLFELRQINSDKQLCFLPENLAETESSSNFIYSETTTDLRKIFKKENITIDYLTENKPLLRSRKSADWFGPTILIGLSALIENPHIVGITLNLISSFLYDFFKGTIRERKVKFEIVIENEKSKDYQKVVYEGTVDGIPELEKVIKSMRK